YPNTYGRPTTSKIEFDIHSDVGENSPKLMIPSTLTDSVNFSNSSSTIPPSNNHQRFKDLLIFEERLKQNLHQLQRRSYKYEGDLMSYY
ncbi:14328_t:CDS:2, partial [Funneliformis mosseae]